MGIISVLPPATKLKVHFRLKIPDRPVCQVHFSMSNAFTFQSVTRDFLISWLGAQATVWALEIRVVGLREWFRVSVETIVFPIFGVESASSEVASDFSLGNDLHSLDCCFLFHVSHTPMILALDKQNALYIFTSTGEAESYLEAIDVLQQSFEFCDAAGQRYLPNFTRAPKESHAIFFSTVDIGAFRLVSEGERDLNLPQSFAKRARYMEHTSVVAITNIEELERELQKRG